MTDTLTESGNSSAYTSTVSEKFRQQLHDVLSKIEITPELAIVHPGYEFPTISQTYQTYLQQMSPTDRHRYLIAKLQRHLYDLFMGRQKPHMPESSQPIVNSGDRWYETEFYQQLLCSNHGRGYGDPGWVVVERCDRYWQVTKNDLNIFIDPQIHLHEPLVDLTAGQTVCLKMPPNLIERGVYIAVGDAGLLDTQNSSASNVLQVYFNADAKTALILLDSLSRQLNHLSISFNLRLAYSDRDYQYLDAAILEFKQENWQQLQPILSQIYAQNQTGFRSEVPFFCQRFRNGLGIAIIPELIPTIEDSTGLKHSRFIAEIVIKRLKKSNISLDNSMNHILKYLEKHKAVL